MPCKIRIKENVEIKVAELSEPGFNMSLSNAKVLARDINTMYDHHVVAFNNRDNRVERVINIPSKLVDKYYDMQVKENIVSNNKDLKAGWTKFVAKGQGITEKEAADKLEQFTKEWVTLYRGEGDTVDLTDSKLPDFVKNSKGRWFTLTENVARSYARTHGGKVYAVQIPKVTYDDIVKATAKYGMGLTNGGEVLVDRIVADNKVDITERNNTVNALNADLNSLNLTSDVVNYLYTTSRSKSKGVSLNTYNKEVQKLIGNLRTDFTNEEIVEKIKCL